MGPKTKRVGMRGFTATPERQREIASLGGKAIRPEDRSFSTDRALAMKAGRKGGLARAKNAALKAKD